MLMNTSSVPRYRNPLAAAPLLVRLIGLWLGRWHQRQDLRELDQRLLNDVGIFRAQRNHELGRPFWWWSGDKCLIARRRFYFVLAVPSSWTGSSLAA